MVVYCARAMINVIIVGPFCGWHLHTYSYIHTLIQESKSLYCMEKKTFVSFDLNLNCRNSNSCLRKHEKSIGLIIFLFGSLLSGAVYFKFVDHLSPSLSIFWKMIHLKRSSEEVLEPTTESSGPLWC